MIGVPEISEDAAVYLGRCDLTRPPSISGAPVTRENGDDLDPYLGESPRGTGR